MQQDIELAQRGAAIDAFQIVLRPEQALPAGLALAAREGAQRKAMAGAAELTGELPQLNAAARAAGTMDELVEGLVGLVSGGDDRRRGWEAS